MQRPPLFLVCFIQLHSGYEKNILAIKADGKFAAAFSKILLKTP